MPVECPNYENQCPIVVEFDSFSSKFSAETATYIYSKNYQLINQSTYVYSLQQLMH